MRHAVDQPIMKPGRLKNRPDFLAAQKGRRLRGPYFLLETLDRGLPGEAPRIGYTVTRKQGNAVKRNRMRRRLREAVRLMATGQSVELAGVPFKPGHDYVVVARRDVLEVPFDKLVHALAERIGESTSQRPKTHRRSGTPSPATDNTKTPGGSSPAIRNE